MKEQPGRFARAGERVGRSFDALIAKVRQPRIERERSVRWLKGQIVPNLGTVIAVVILLMTVPSLAAPRAAPQAASTSTISYQGRLADSGGSPLTGMYNLEFRIYDVPAGGTPLWEEFWTGGNSVSISDGLFNVMLGSIETDLYTSIDGEDELYLGITVGTDSEMEPRVQLGSVPFSMQAMTVPDGSITTDKLDDGAVTQAKLSGDVTLGPALLGQKSCELCGNPSETVATHLTPVKGASVGDIVEVTATTNGGPVLAHMTSRQTITPSGPGFWCIIQVLQGGSQIRAASVYGGQTIDNGDAACSGTFLFTDLAAGTYTFRAIVWIPPGRTVQWTFERQIAVYEF